MSKFTVMCDGEVYPVEGVSRDYVATEFISLLIPEEFYVIDDNGNITKVDVLCRKIESVMTPLSTDMKFHWGNLENTPNETFDKFNAKYEPKPKTTVADAVHEMKQSPTPRSNKFKVGDVVQLNSGGNRMTVREVQEDGNVIVWLAEFKGHCNEMRCLGFPSECLKLVED